MPTLVPCASCAELLFDNVCVCAHCGAKRCRNHQLSTAAFLLGLAVAAPGCMFEPTQSDYTGASTEDMADDDDDGWTVGGGDCDDVDPDVNPDATETPGDGVDSNCNDEDDT